MARRSSLREFQENLIAKLTSARRGEEQRAMLGFESAHQYWLVRLAESGEVLPLTDLTPVPLTKPWFAGVTNVRGALYSVVDFAAFRGLEATPHNSEARLLLIGARHGINAALLVQRTLGLKNPELFHVSPAAEASTQPPPWIAARMSDAQGHLWTQLDVRSLLATPEFMNIGL